MIIRTAGNQLLAPLQKALGQSLAVLHYLLPISLKLRLQGFSQTNRLSGDDMHQRTALSAGENGLVNLLGEFLLA